MNLVGDLLVTGFQERRSSHKNVFLWCGKMANIYELFQRLMNYFFLRFVFFWGEDKRYRKGVVLMNQNSRGRVATTAIKRRLLQQQHKVTYEQEEKQKCQEDEPFPLSAVAPTEQLVYVEGHHCLSNEQMAPSEALLAWHRLKLIIKNHLVEHKIIGPTGKRVNELIKKNETRIVSG